MATVQADLASFEDPRPAELRGLSPAVVRSMDLPALDRLAAAIRGFLVQAVSTTGGHLGSNLGAVELSLSLHRVFDSPTDRIVWDTGHQAYVHKLLTGRTEDFAGLRQPGGMSGYPNREESPHDLVENSHASTALSYAAGLAHARRLQGGSHQVVAVVGDGALTGGLTYEALSNIGTAGTKVVVVLNDNGRSYSPTVSRLTTAPPNEGRGPVPMGAHNGTNRGAHSGANGGPHSGAALHAVPDLGDLVDLPAAPGEAIPAFTEPPAAAGAPLAFFNALGLSYCGPIDGHDVAALDVALRWAARCEGPAVVHVHTVKGRGYPPAEEDDEKCLHDVAPFDPATGRPRKAGRAPSYTEAFSTALLVEAAQRPEVVAITAAMAGPTGLLPFAARFPDRFVDVGIAEQHAVTAAAGMAMGGLRPVVAIYSTFLSRAWDQLYHDVGLHRLPVVFCIDRAGVTGDDGPSHHGLLDMALLTKVPGMTVLVPSSYEEVPAMLHQALSITDGPVAIRWPKTEAGTGGPVGSGLSARKLRAGAGGDVCLLGLGKLVEPCGQAAELLASRGIDATVWDMRAAAPLDPTMITDALSHRVVITAEDGIAEGGVGSMVAAALRRAAAASTIPAPGPQVVNCGLPLAYLSHGRADCILADQGLDGPGLARAARTALAAVTALGRGLPGN